MEAEIGMKNDSGANSFKRAAKNAHSLDSVVFAFYTFFIGP